MRTPFSLLLVFAVGCAGSEPFEMPEESIGWLDPEDVVFDTEGGQMRVDALQVLLKEIVLDADSDERSVSRSIPNTKDCDVLAAVCDPELPVIELEATTWFNLYFGVEIDDDVSGRDAIELDATIEDGRGQTPVAFRFNSGEVFEIEKAQLQLDAPLSVNAGRMFHPARWFSSLDLTEGEVGEDGVMWITPTENTGLHTAASDALDRALREVFDDGTFE